MGTMESRIAVQMGALAVRALAVSVERHETEVADSARCGFCMLLKIWLLVPYLRYL